jgi:Ran GTPase-activating protein (RanGAP) involved in mRNA processing and transport
MGDQILKELLKKLKEAPDTRLKSLDLYGNDATTEITNDICEFVETNKSVEFLGLSKNALGAEDFLKALFATIGEVPLSE